MKTFYSTYILLEQNQLDEAGAIQNAFYYQVHHSPELQCDIAEEVDSGKTSWVIYYDKSVDAQLLKYHQLHYGDIRFSCFINVEPFVKKLCNYHLSTLTGYLILVFDQAHRQIISQELDASELLIEYRQFFYDNSGKDEKEKIFYPSSWIIMKKKLNHQNSTI